MRIELFCLHDLKENRFNSVFKGHKKRVWKASFISNDAEIISVSEDHTIRIWDKSLNENIYKLSHPWIYGKCVQYIETDSIVLFDTWTGVSFFDLREDNDSLIMYDLCELDKSVFDIEISHDKKSIIVISDENRFHLYDFNTKKLINTFDQSSSWTNSVKFGPLDKFIISSSIDNIGLITSLSDFKSKIEFVNCQEDNWIFKLENSPYYMCSKGASKALHYVTPSLKVIGFDQLDPVYNRPDIVLDSIGKYFGGADQELVARYREAWEKRIDRLGLDKEKLGKGEISVPNAEFVGAEDIAYENNSGQLELKVEANDPKYILRRFNILVNEVPLYGSEGISIASRGLMDWDTTISVPLGVGENKIQVSVMNELGLENFKYPTYVNYTPENEEMIVSKTYFIGIGVDDFEDDQIADLDYCVKDIRDLSKEFKSSKNTDTIVLTNDQVTKENIQLSKTYSRIQACTIK